MLKRFLQELETLVGDNARQKRYLVALSGGADSTVTATFFHEAGLDFALAHCNFHLRGADSDRDMHFVEKLAEQWKVRLYLREFDTLEIQKDSGKSVEMVARELRYAWFDELLPDFDYLVTAHQRNDAAETVLLNLTRGTGLKGLCGIPSVNGKIIRPMLPFTAQKIREYADTHHIDYVVDNTNDDTQIARNRVRHSVIPQLESLNPHFLETNARSREILQRQYSYYQKHIENDLQKIVTVDDECLRVNRILLYNHENAELLLYELLTRFGFATNVCETLAGNGNLQPGKQFFSESHILLVDREFLIIKPKSEKENDVINIEFLDDLKHHFEIEEFEYQKDMVFEKNPNILYIPKEKLTFPMQIRPWQAGDSFFPLGAKGRQKLSDYFTDHKIDRFAKERIRLLCINDQIVWIIGWRSDERFKLTPQTEKYYRIKT